MTQNRRFVHIGDTHLYQSPRQADRLKALEQIITEQEKEPDLAAWLWPGDIFDSKSDIHTRNVLKEYVKRMSMAAPVVGCYGNHDAPGDLAIFEDIGTFGAIKFCDKPEIVKIDGASIFVLPYPTEAGLVGQGVAPGDIPTQARAALETLFIDFGAHLKAAAAKGRHTIMIGHINVAGAISSTGQPSIGKEIELDQALLAHIPEKCPILLSHIHKEQSVGRAHYAGSICRLNWGEVEKKSYQVLHFEGQRQFITTHPIDVAPMYHVTGTLRRGQAFTWKVDGGDAPQTWRGCEVRVRAEYLQSEGSVLEDEWKVIRHLFKDAERLELEPVCVPDRALRSIEVAMAKSLSEKLTEWAKLTGVVLPEKAAERIFDLETRDADAVISETESRMADLRYGTSTIRT